MSSHRLQSTPPSKPSLSLPLHRGGDWNKKGLLIARGGIKGLEISAFKIKECTGRKCERRMQKRGEQYEQGEENLYRWGSGCMLCFTVWLEGHCWKDALGPSKQMCFYSQTQLLPFVPVIQIHKQRQEDGISGVPPFETIYLMHLCLILSPEGRRQLA